MLTKSPHSEEDLKKKVNNSLRLQNDLIKGTMVIIVDQTEDKEIVPKLLQEGQIGEKELFLLVER